ncbi:hypothetical protein JAAARDRAFT_158528 [Jaapia argillacea MUCL 33604]|uniref:Mitochondrial carrier n=1 Tax=Jaapia argillacea MUCL 33604 TaxID=933084 RepID=A0A067PYY4_9AGAM|nr:hypothetical protein JAAARDRAFT_158528 [Jaapia argillacea MUCL 33604]
MTSTLSPLVQAFSGAVGSATANALTYPLDLVTTRLQITKSKKLRGFLGLIRILRHVIHQHGFDALYDGLLTDTFATILSNFFYFYAYTSLRHILTHRKSLRLSPPSSTQSKSNSRTLLLSVPEELAIGFVAGVLSRAISTPLSVVTARMQAEADGDDDEEVGLLGAEEEERRKDKGVMGVVKRIYGERGLLGFWRGFETTILLSLNPSLTLYLYQLFRRLLLRGPDRVSPNPKQAFVGAAVANSIAVALLYPLILAKTRLQAQPSPSRTSSSSSSLSSSAPTIWHAAYAQDGVAGLYQGLESQILKGFLGQGVTMMVKQRVEAWVVELWVAWVFKKRSG